MISEQKLFRLWFGYGAPFYFFGAAIYAASFSWWLAALLFISYIFRIYDSFATTCSRCSHYGTSHCGLPGLTVKLFFSKKHDMPSKARIKIHFYTDLIFIFLTWLVYLSNIYLLILASIWAVGAWLIVFKQKRFHGLLYRLR